MKKLNEKRVERLKNGEVVLYTADKKGSEEVKNLLRWLHKTIYVYGISGKADFYALDEDGDFGNISVINKLNNRPIYPVEWFYEEENTESKILNYLVDFEHDNNEGFISTSDCIKIAESITKLLTEI